MILKQPSLIIFDVDGVLVDTRGSFQRTTLQTVRLFTGKRVTRAELHRWKNRPGFNDDWKLSHVWINSLGADYGYDEIKKVNPSVVYCSVPGFGQSARAGVAPGGVVAVAAQPGVEVSSDGVVVLYDENVESVPAMLHT